MPLSEHEQRLLDEIEQALYAEDPKFASAVRSARRHSSRRTSMVLSLLCVLGGLALVLVGLLATVIVLSVVGFVLVVGGSVYGVQAIRRSASSTASPSPARQPRQGGVRGRMEDRLRRRFDEN